MSTRQWVPTHATRVSGGIGSRLNPDRWIISYLYRFYFPPEPARKRIIGLLINLFPPDGFTVPVCLGFTARFAKPQTHNQLWRNWKDSDPTSRAFINASEGCPTVLEEIHYQQFLPEASTVSGLIIPLCALHTEDDLNTRIVEPLFAADANPST